MSGRCDSCGAISTDLTCEDCCECVKLRRLEDEVSSLEDQNTALKSHLAEAQDHIVELLGQACGDHERGGVFDGAISTYEDAAEYLVAEGYLKPPRKVRGLQIYRWTERVTGVGGKR